MKSTRREFLMALTLGGAVAINSTCNITKISRPLLSEARQTELEITHLVDSDKAESLEQLLNKENDLRSISETGQGPTAKVEAEGINFIINSFPGIIYNFEFKYLDGNYKIKRIFQAQTTMLNSYGFFFTPFHCIEKVVDGPNNRFMLVHEPVTGQIETPKILAYFREYDIALCVMPDFEGAPAITLANNDLNMGDRLISVSYDGPMYLESQFQSDFESSGEFYPYFEGDVAKIGYLQSSPLKKRLLELGLKIDFGVVMQGNPADGIIIPEGTHFAAIQNEKGDSGSPLFDLNGALTGILLGSKEGDIMKDEKFVMRHNVTRYAGAKVLRNILRQYVDAVMAHSN